MGKKWIDKKNATTFTLVHRPQNDPLIHDEQASSMIFKEVGSGNASKKDGNKKIKTTTDLEEELGSSVTTSIRKNEGEAANYGIYYDDTKYDYMQHLRDIGVSHDSVFVEANTNKKPTKQKLKLEDALREEPAPSATLLPADMLPSNSALPRKSYQAQQNIPDALAGFQPDMDPRLREVLEALEDEEYVDDDEDLFGMLTKDGEADEDEFFEQSEQFEEEYDEEDDGWNTDDTEKPVQKAAPSSAVSEKQQKQAPPSAPSKAVSFGDSNGQFDDAEEDEAEASPAWLKEYSKFKKEIKKNKSKIDDDASSMGGTMSIGTSMTMSTSARTRRRNKKHGTTSSEYSMSSSSMTRTEGLTLLDDRFEKIEEEYAEDDEDDEDSHIPLSQREGAFIETRADFNSMMDDFLENYSVKGKSGRVKKGKYQTGIEQLDEVRSQLGKARITPSIRRNYC